MSTGSTTNLLGLIMLLGLDEIADVVLELGAVALSALRTGSDRDGIDVGREEGLQLLDHYVW